MKAFVTVVLTFIVINVVLGLVNMFLWNYFCPRFNLPRLTFMDAILLRWLVQGFIAAVQNSKESK